MAHRLYDYTYDLLFTYLPLKRFLLSLIATDKTKKQMFKLFSYIRKKYNLDAS